ncbi:2'-hydroxybiphenyl-2-sulfinate desulfinase [Mycobacterium avium subsp. hominissuis]|uniref:2'-hydroxybiphenyl-2-sulfinate desulfinase n=1 Tax=Mycobacterium avium TaxID=1764 RepID=UPI00293AAE65|nr:2'-hydroxybiphenyl-2-sulfinate desulfinase [Mycobacterium avium]MDV3245720.1 2'-hydroxybiphenyl-2-sulfinate desulfinase [Mycobacterium avium subsp. hominissuis]MDV3276690.1 2'-hydroxybiphenyl-2-sulfinate desulfinase [Mycobacterium avium subsp. hominissuis]MDV3324238.1 2'-hydroxybiphenyl-2-sulfinate desulfinase [Mycobacterium avium subsp. hominissuis]
MTSQYQSAAPPVARLTYSNCPLPNPLVTALGAGTLSAAGIELGLLDGGHGTLHFTFDDPSYTRFGGEIPPLLSEGLRAPGRTRLLGIIPFTGRQGYYVNSDSPIRHPVDLAGRRIGVSDSAIRILTGELGDYLDLDPWRQTLVGLGTWEARALLHTLHAGGLGLAAVELVRIANPFVDVPAQRLDTLASLNGADLFADAADHQAAVLGSGAVDALFGWLPWAAELERRWHARSVADLSSDEANTYATVWTVSSALVSERPDVVQQLVDAVVQAGVWAGEHRDAVIDVHADNLGVSAEAITSGFGADFHQRLVPRLDDASLDLLQRTQRFLLDHHLLARPLALDRWAAPEFLTSSFTRFPERTTA